jgi:hypothetical protein
MWNALSDNIAECGLINVRQKSMEPSVINSTQPILYETGYKEWPYAYAGSCYPVRWNKNLYIISAYHCYENHGVKPEITLYSIPKSKPVQFYGFNLKLTPKITNSEDNKHKDQVILAVSNELHTQNIVDLTVALDLSDNENIISISDSDISDVWLRGYLSTNDAHKIDYEKKKIKPKAYVTNGIVSTRVSKSDHCYLLKVKTPYPKGLSPDGMSGSPVYAINKQGRFGLAGTIIEFNFFTNEFLVIESAVLRELIRRENA